MKVRKTRGADDLLKHWQMQIAEYVRRKREELGKGQKEIPVVRQTLSSIENGNLNFTLKNLLDVLGAVEGDISEAFQAKTPSNVPPQYRHTVGQLLEILERGDEAAAWIAGNIETFHSNYCRTRRPPR